MSAYFSCASKGAERKEDHFRCRRQSSTIVK